MDRYLAWIVIRGKNAGNSANISWSGFRNPFMRSQYNALRLALALLLISALNANGQELVRVKRVIDGDTIMIESGERVRLLGVNTPETKHPNKQVEYFGKEASDFTKKMVEGKLVKLEYDPLASKRDKYSRTLAYVFLQDGTHLNAEIIRQGYGFAISSRPPLKYQDEFRRLEREAREQRRGLWAKTS